TTSDPETESAWTAGSPRRRRLDHSGTKALSEARPLRSALSRSRRLLDDLRGLPRMRQERDVARRDLARRRADPLRVEPLELRVDCRAAVFTWPPGVARDTRWLPGRFPYGAFRHDCPDERWRGRCVRPDVEGPKPVVKQCPAHCAPANEEAKPAGERSFMQSSQRLDGGLHSAANRR